MVASTSMIKLLAAGCIVGVLTGVSVRANSAAIAEDDIAEYEEAPMDEEMEDGDEAEEDDAYYDDVFAPPGEFEDEPPEEEAEPTEEDDEPPLEDDEPPLEEAEPPMEETEEYDDTMAPDDAEEEATPEPDPDTLKGLGYDIVEGVDYIPGPGKSAMVADVGDLMVASAEECAEMCTADPGCNMAAYFVEDGPGGSNCYLKGLSPGCAVPPDTDPADGTWLLVSDSKCDVDVAAMAPGVAPDAALTSLPAGMYTRYPGNDYIPSSVTGSAPNLVTVEDIVTGETAGMLVETIEKCEAACDAEPTCNAASFYTEVIATNGKNCYLKALGDSCGLPEDAIDDPNATLSLKCDGTLSVAPAPEGIGAAPPATDTAFETPPTTTGGVDAADREAAVGPPADGGAEVADTPSSAAAVCTSLAAVAFAGAAALL